VTDVHRIEGATKYADAPGAACVIHQVRT